jgi:hypothetical protein
MPRPFKADPTALYFTDNGCILCGEHLGSSAKFTGRDISGQKIKKVTPDDARAAAKDGWTLKCEGNCERTANADAPSLRWEDQSMSLRLDRPLSRPEVKAILARFARMLREEAEDNVVDIGALPDLLGMAVEDTLAPRSHSSALPVEVPAPSRLALSR